MTNLEQVFSDSARRAAASLSEPSSPSARERAERSIGRRRVAWSVGSSSVAALVVGALAIGTWDLTHRSPIEPGPAPSASDPTPPVPPTTVPALPDADVEFSINTETYPSAWEALGLEPVQGTQGDGEQDRVDGSVWHTVTRDDGSVQLGTRDAGGELTVLTDWLPNDQGQQWDPIVASGDWLVYADNAGWHEDGPASAPWVLLLNTTTGVTDVVAERTFAEKQPSCFDCMNARAVTEAQIVGDWLYWNVIDPSVSRTEGVLSSRLLAGGETTDLLAGNYLFDDASCVTTPGADVRVSGYAPGDISVDTPRLAWDVSGDILTPVTAVGDPVVGPGVMMGQNCAGVDIVVWYKTLDESTLDDGVSAYLGDNRPILVNAIDFVSPDGRARVSNDDPLIGPSVDSQIRGWAVVWLSSMGDEGQRFLLLDTDTWHMYEIGSPDGSAPRYAKVLNGRLVVYLGPNAAGEETIISAPLP